MRKTHRVHDSTNLQSHCNLQLSLAHLSVIFSVSQTLSNSTPAPSFHQNFTLSRKDLWWVRHRRHPSWWQQRLLNRYSEEIDLRSLAKSTTLTRTVPKVRVRSFILACACRSSVRLSWRRLSPGLRHNKPFSVRLPLHNMHMHTHRADALYNNKPDIWWDTWVNVGDFPIPTVALKGRVLTSSFA